MGQFGKCILKIIISFFGSGLISKKCPGTIGSILAAAMLIFIPGNLITLFLLGLISFVIGLIACHLYIIKYKFDTNKDPGYIVIDEACGMFIGAFILGLFYKVTPYDIIMLLWLFRVFDIIKPFSIDRLECICKRHKNTIALGIMIDDVIAAVMAAGIKLTF